MSWICDGHANDRLGVHVDVWRDDGEYIQTICVGGEVGHESDPVIRKRNAMAGALDNLRVLVEKHGPLEALEAVNSRINRLEAIGR